jgi:hypothetical protein
MRKYSLIVLFIILCHITFGQNKLKDTKADSLNKIAADYYTKEFNGGAKNLKVNLDKQALRVKRKAKKKKRIIK